MNGYEARQADVDDRLLALGAANGDPRAFSRIVERYQASVYGLCRRYVGPTEAEDLAQEAFVRAFVHRQRFDPERPLKPWLLTLARNLCIDRLRSAERRQRAMTDVSTFPDRTADTERVVACRQELVLLRQGLEQLAEGPREAVALFHLDGLSYRELAEILDVPVGTVMTWLHRGRQKLKELVRPSVAVGPDDSPAESGGE